MGRAVMGRIYIFQVADGVEEAWREVRNCCQGLEPGAAEPAVPRARAGLSGRFFTSEPGPAWLPPCEVVSTKATITRVCGNVPGAPAFSFDSDHSLVKWAEVVVFFLPAGAETEAEPMRQCARVYSAGGRGGQEPRWPSPGHGLSSGRPSCSGSLRRSWEGGTRYMQVRAGRLQNTLRI